MKAFLAGLFVIGALVIGIGPPGVGAANGFAPPAGIVLHSGAPAVRTTHARATSGIFGCAPISCAAYQSGVNGFLQDVAHDSGGSQNVYSVATEYSDNTGSIAYNQAFGGTYPDTAPFPASGCPTNAQSTCLTESQLVTAIQRDMTVKGWTGGGTKIYTILLPAGVDTCFDGTGNICASNYFCAYHSAVSTTIFAVEPFNASFSCSAASELLNPQGFPNGAEIDETINTLSHETNEAITDPYPNSGWATAQGNENGDMCAWWFGAPIGTTAGAQPYNQVINGHDYSLQQEYSNAANTGTGGCLQHHGGTASTASPYVQDTGLLTYHGGSVMRSVTTYTIYWIPDGSPAPTPSNSTAPTVSGTAAVGKTLSTTTGTWTNSPTGYAYQWQRCDAQGLNCGDLPYATGSTYKLVAADAGHEIRSEVLASNGFGPAAGYTPSSNATAVVVGKPAVVTKPALSGPAKVGKKLAVSAGTWTYGPSLSYEWFRCPAKGAGCVPIGGATSNHYKLASKDADQKVAVKVTATNAAGSTSLTLKSAKVAK